MRHLLFSLCTLCLALPAYAADSPLTLKLISKKDKYEWDRDQEPKDFAKSIEDALKLQKEGKIAKFPRPSATNLTLQITNTGKEAVSIFVEGDANEVALEMKGPGVLTAKPPLAFTADFRLPKEMKLEAGKSYEVNITMFADGFRGGSRYIYFTTLGEYTLTASYQLATNDGGKGKVLKSEAIKFTVEAAKK